MLAFVLISLFALVGSSTSPGVYPAVSHSGMRSFLFFGTEKSLFLDTQGQAFVSVSPPTWNKLTNEAISSFYPGTRGCLLIGISSSSTWYFSYETNLLTTLNFGISFTRIVRHPTIEETFIGLRASCTGCDYYDLFYCDFSNNSPFCTQVAQYVSSVAWADTEYGSESTKTYMFVNRFSYSLSVARISTVLTNQVNSVISVQSWKYGSMAQVNTYGDIVLKLIDSRYSTPDLYSTSFPLPVQDCMLALDGSRGIFFAVSYDVHSPPHTGQLFVSRDDRVNFMSTAVTALEYSNDMNAWMLFFTEIDGVLIANNDTSNGNDGTSLISYDYGITWDDMNIHLINEPLTNRHVPGVFIGNSKNEALISWDAGHHWDTLWTTPVKSIFLNYGNLIVFFPNSQNGSSSSSNSNDRLFYTTDAKTVRWLDFYSYGISDYRIVDLFAFESEPKVVVSLQNQLIVVDFSPIFTRNCLDSEIESFVVHPLCALGTVDSYKRKVQGNLDSLCKIEKSMVGKISSVNCLCTREDYICDNGFLLENSTCVNNSPISACVPGTTYLVPSGYATKFGDKCSVEGGLDLRATTAKCPSKNHADDAWIWFIISLSIVVFVLLVAGALLTRFSCISRMLRDGRRPNRRSLRLRAQQELEFVEDIEGLIDQSMAREQAREERRKQEEREDEEEKQLAPLFDSLNELLITASEKGEDVDVPNPFLCAITQDIMKEPTITKCGHTFERSALRQWLRKRRVCPTCRQRVHRHALRSNYALKSLILEWVQKQHAVLKHKYGVEDVEMSPLENTIDRLDDSQNEEAKE